MKVNQRSSRWRRHPDNSDGLNAANTRHVRLTAQLELHGYLELWLHLRSTTSTGASSWSANLGNVAKLQWLRCILSVSFVPGYGRSLDAVLGDVDALRDE